MAVDKSYIIVPTISFTNSIKTGIASTSVIATGSATNKNVGGYRDVKRPTNIEDEITKELEDTRDRGANAATVQSSDGGSGPTGLGDTLDSGPDNSRLGGTNNGGGTPSF